MAWWRKPSAQPPHWSLEDYHTAFVATVTAQIAQGVAPWQQSWTPGARRLPEHLVSGHAYRGVPALYLSVAHTAKGYRDNRWATATEIQALGGQVRPGEQATPVLIDTGDDEQAPRPPGAPDTGQPPGGEQDHAQARSPLVRVDDVFHVEQVDGLTLARRDDDRDQEPKWKTHRTAERMQESGVHVRHERGDRAFYNMQTDTVIGEVHHQVKLTESAAPDWRMRSRHGATMPAWRCSRPSGPGRPPPVCPPSRPTDAGHRSQVHPARREPIAPERPHRRGGRRATSPPRRGQASTILGGGSLRALWKVYPSRPGGDAAREHSLAPAEGSTGPSPAEPGRSCP